MITGMSTGQATTQHHTIQQPQQQQPQYHTIQQPQQQFVHQQQDDHLLDAVQQAITEQQVQQQPQPQPQVSLNMAIGIRLN